MARVRWWMPLLLVGLLLALWSPGPVKANDDLRCSLCQKVITGQYWQGGGRIFCDDCYKNAPRCANCKLPMQDFYTTADGRKICPTCLPKLPRCALCGEPITGNLWSSVSIVTGTRRDICRICYEASERCSACGHFTLKASRHLPDGRPLCSECWKSAIMTLPVAKSIYLQADSIMRKTLGLSITHLPGLVLASHPELTAARSKYGGNYQSDVSGFCYLKSMVTNDQGQPGEIIEERIYLVYGLPAAELLRVSAHELGHAWFNEHCPRGQSPLVVEGFADWVAYKVMESRGNTAIIKSMLERNDIYGQGLRALLEKERQGGVPAVMRAIQAR